MKACAYAPTHICIFIVQCLSCGQLFVTPRTAAHQVSMPFTISISTHTGFTGDPVVKNPPTNTGNTRDAASSLWSGGYPEEGNGSPLQDFCLHNPMDRGAWQLDYNPWVRKESDTTEYAHTHTGICGHIAVSQYLGGVDPGALWILLSSDAQVPHIK